MYNFEKKDYQEKFEIMLVDCDLTIMTLNYLQSAGINQLNEITYYTEEALKKKVPPTNSRIFQEIQQLLTKHGLSFRLSE